MTKSFDYPLILKKKKSLAAPHGEFATKEKLGFTREKGRKEIVEQKRKQKKKTDSFSNVLV